ILIQYLISYFFFNDTTTPEIYTLSLHDALPISCITPASAIRGETSRRNNETSAILLNGFGTNAVPFFMVLSSSRHPEARKPHVRSEEHTSELQSRRDLVCRLLLEKKKKQKN